MVRPALLSLSLLLLGCRGTEDARQPAPDAVGSDLELLAAWMTGSFSSQAQSEIDPENYFDIRLFMTPIWTDGDDGVWLYVEQAAADRLEWPYRQRVYHLVEESGALRSDVFELPGDPLEYAGAWATPERFDALGPLQLSLREGCSIHLRRRGDTFVGSTLGKGSSSTLGGASYATSEVEINRDALTSWDRGFDASDLQVWGATEGPYAFDRSR